MRASELSSRCLYRGCRSRRSTTVLFISKEWPISILLEQNIALGQAFRGEHLNEEGEAVLKSHQLFEAVEALGILRMEKLEYYAEGKAFKTIFPDEAVGHLGIHVPQANLLQGILQKARQFPHFSCFLHTKVTQLLKDSSGRYIGVVARKDGETIEIGSQLIIGADGRYSTIRKHAQIDIQKRKHGFDLLWAKILAPHGWEPSIKMALIGDKQLSLFTQVGGFIQIGWNIEQGSFAQLKKTGLYSVYPSAFRGISGISRLSKNTDHLLA